MNFIFENFKTADYHLIFKWVLGCYIIFGSLTLLILENRKREFIKNDRNLLVVFVIFTILFSGTRGQNIGVDTYNYYHYFYLKGLHIRGIFNFFETLNTDLFLQL